MENLFRKLAVIIISILIFLSILFFPTDISRTWILLIFFIFLTAILPVYISIKLRQSKKKSSAVLYYFLSIFVLFLIVPQQFLIGLFSSGLCGGKYTTGAFFSKNLFDLCMSPLYTSLIIVPLLILAYRLFDIAEKNRTFGVHLLILKCLNIALMILIITFFLFWHFHTLFNINL